MVIAIVARGDQDLVCTLHAARKRLPILRVENVDSCVIDVWTGRTML
jgi:hypothetical protein